MDWRYNTIWYEQIESNKILKKAFKSEESILNLENIEYAILMSYKSKGISFDKLSHTNNLLYLELNSSTIEDFSGIDKFSFLKRLEIHYCVKLENDIGLSSLKANLEWLHINQSKKLSSLTEITQLANLKVLCLNSCGPIDNLQFLNKFPKLIDFRFVNTNILDGDLTPLIEHPTLKSVGFSNKRHYNFSDEQINSKLRLKSEKKLKDYVYKGEFKTFKYTEID